MKSVLLKITLLILFVLLADTGVAQVYEKLEKMKDGSFRVRSDVNFKRSYLNESGSGESVDLNVPFSVNLYSDFQETELLCTVKNYSVLAFDRLPTVNLYLLNFKDEGVGKVYACTFKGSVMIDSLLIGRYSDNLVLKQFGFYRTSQRNSIEVRTYELIPLDRVKHNWSDMKKMIAGRCDISYTINEEGKFVKRNPIRYYSEVYTRKFLMNPYYDIWEGEERKIDKKKNNESFFRSNYQPKIYNQEDSLDAKPIFPGGADRMNEFIASKVKQFLALRTEPKQSGDVVVNFVIDEAGEATQLTIVSGINQWQNRMAEEIVRQMSWNPGMLNGRDVSVLSKLTVSF